MTLLNPLDKPEYLLRPSQIARRLRGPRLVSGAPDAAARLAEAMLPWGLPIRFRPDESIGSSIWRTGLYDLCVSETIWRLLNAGERAVDAGANIGHMTSVMAARVGSEGTVDSYEPHPDVFAELAANAACWARQRAPRTATIHVHQVALSNGAGTATLEVPEGFARNRGIATLAGAGAGALPPARSFRVSTVRLADVVSEETPVGLLKIDVEGHELAVLDGAEPLVARRQVRDVVFEEHGAPPTPVTRFLEAHGYLVFRIVRGRFGPVIRPIAAPRGPGEARGGSHDALSYLATCAPERAVARMARKGWAVLGAGPRPPRRLP